MTAPADAIVIEGAGMTVYPGLIDMGNTAGTDIALNLAQAQQGSRDDRRGGAGEAGNVILRPHVLAAEHVALDAPELSRLAAGGVTSVLATPPGDPVQGAERARQRHDAGIRADRRRGDHSRVPDSAC